ncbi:MAG: DNA primase, partial [Patescibacteria group bacterium]
MASQAVEEIKSKIDLADLVGEYVQLKKAGVNYKAPCPFHHEKTPSFLVSKEKQIWHCFGCGEGGDIFGFIMRIEGLDFPEALKLLAERAGVKLQEFHSEISASARNRILDILKMAAKFYHKILLDSSQAEEARQYLNKRQVAAEMLEEFQIGYIPDEWDILTNFLLKKGFGINDLVAAGLTIKKEGGGYYDRFRGRIMFPIADVHGNVVGFTGRLLNENKVEAGGKYVNTPQTIVFDKSRLLYALDRAKQVARKQNKLIIVEGQMDVVSCYQFGQTNTVASSGTALTLDQVKLIKRFTNNIYIAFDMDAAGQHAADRGIDLALSEGMNIKIIVVPKDFAKDPDECLKKDPAVWFKSVEEARSIMDYFFDKTFAGRDLKNPEKRGEAAKILLEQISRLGDTVEQ